MIRPTHFRILTAQNCTRWARNDSHPPPNQKFSKKIHFIGTGIRNAIDLNVRRILAILLLANSLAQLLRGAPVEIPFEFREGLIWVKANSNSGECLNLLLDSGASSSLLNTAAAERLGLKRGRAISVRGVESSLNGYLLKPLPLSAQGFQLPAPSLATDLHKLSASCERPVDGLIGADFFRDRTVQIDFDACELRLLSDAPDRPNAQALPLQLRSCGMRVPLAINGGKTQWFRLDTGCVSALQWVTSTVRADACSRRRAIALAQLSIPQTETTVKIGASEFESVPTGLHERPIFQGEAGLLGNGLLARFSKITIDAKSCRLILERRSE